MLFSETSGKTQKYIFGEEARGIVPAGNLYAKVLVDVPGLGPLDYKVPDDMLVAVGDRITANIQTRKVVGVVAALENATDLQGKRIRSITSVLNDVPPLSAEWLALTRFASLYYLRGWGEAALSALPLFFKRLPKKNHRAMLEKFRRKGIAPSVERSSTQSKPVLNAEQMAAVDAVVSAKGFVPFLLFGVTGSGKTEVYLHVMEEVLHRDPEAQVLLLVPEINLTPQLQARVKARFPHEYVAAMHSEYSDGERAAAWLAVHEGRARILVGTRLSIFSSFKKLALILVDEEHDLSYKAGDGLRYSARDLAVWRAAKNSCPVVLGSATPSLESWAKALKKEYVLLTLTQRAMSKAKLPQIDLIDPNPKGSGMLVSPEAEGSIRSELDAGRQVLVFLNRRGYSPVLSCPSCGWVSACIRCSAFTVFHKREKALICHHCGWRRPVPDACPVCGNVDILPRGTGTERLEEELERLFPGKRILRIDRDSTSKKHEAEKAFARVHAGEVDILVGTQMIAKGHDFQNVGLVVILNADTQLLSPAARAREHLFSTLMQVAGRAGRANGKGRVLIQTRFKDEPLFEALRLQDYRRFANETLEERRENFSVPFVYQALITAESDALAKAVLFLETIARRGRGVASGEVRVFDPVPMPLVRLMNRERAQLLVEGDERKTLHRFLRGLLEGVKSPSDVVWQVEIDPTDV